jgi:hypothetical protein
MAIKHERSSERQHEAGQLIWPKPTSILRPLRESEIETLERSLTKPVERKWLVHWISQGIADVVMLCSLPTAKEYRNEVERLARNGRQWIEQINTSFAGSFLRRNPRLSTLARNVAELCEGLDATAGQLDAGIKAGRRRAAALDSFLDKHTNARDPNGCPSAAFFHIRRCGPRSSNRRHQHVLTARAAEDGCSHSPPRGQ